MILNPKGSPKTTKQKLDYWLESWKRRFGNNSVPKKSTGNYYHQIYGKSSKTKNK